MHAFCELSSTSCLAPWMADAAYGAPSIAAALWQCRMGEDCLRRQRPGDRRQVDGTSSPGFPELKVLLKTPIVFDGRHMHQPAGMPDAGLEHLSIHRWAAASGDHETDRCRLRPQDLNIGTMQ